MRALTVDGPYLSARGYDALAAEQLDCVIETAQGDSQTLQLPLKQTGQRLF